MLPSHENRRINPVSRVGVFFHQVHIGSSGHNVFLSFFLFLNPIDTNTSSRALQVDYNRRGRFFGTIPTVSAPAETWRHEFLN